MTHIHTQEYQENNTWYLKPDCSWDGCDESLVIGVYKVDGVPENASDSDLELALEAKLQALTGVSEWFCALHTLAMANLDAAGGNESFALQLAKLESGQDHSHPDDSDTRGKHLYGHG